MSEGDGEELEGEEGGSTHQSMFFPMFYPLGTLLGPIIPSFSFLMVIKKSIFAIEKRSNVD